MRRIGYYLKFIVLVTGVLVVLAGCQASEKKGLQIKVGTVSGPESQLLEVVKNVAQEKYGLQVNIVTFPDTESPNQALEEGKIDANMFQHLPYLAMWQALHGVNNLIPVAKTFIYPMGIYSMQINNLSELPENATVAIPADPTNQARALLLLQTAHLIRLSPEVKVTASLKNIIANPKNLQFFLLQASKITSSLDKVTIAVVNNNFALAAGLYPEVKHDIRSHDDAIYLEGNDSLYTNVVVIRAGEQYDTRIQQFIHALQSSQVLAASRTIFRSTAVPG